MRVTVRICLLVIVGCLAPGFAAASDIYVSGKVVLGGGSVVISVNPSRGYGHGYGRHPGYRHHGYRQEGYKNRAYRKFRRNSHFGRIARDIIHEDKTHPHKASTLPQISGHGKAYGGPFHSGFASGSSAKSTEYGAPLMHRKRKFGLKLR
ncbi:hypothetical protein [Roseobacter ponti]|uniref:Uncharacterized protein n=1 Tax=Roseobacter ponti TaxID=1891787 RepID=A0A858SZD1_9RHOB|nr:hypothetical protein [Roseobacter ponti]QJF52851.1 hypothetical protein G3256_17570 [Roseobacter ponti]